jgi:arginyl-tRNA--protein-N-Asp/Glu arginylyltransferase
MSDMTVLDYAMMVEDTHVDTKIIEYRRRGPDSFITGKGRANSIAVALTDRWPTACPWSIPSSIRDWTTARSAPS